MQNDSRWVVWSAEKVGDRITKIPYSAKSGNKASSTDPSTWVTYEVAKRASEFFTGVGIVFTPDEKLLGVDMDHVLDASGELKEEHKKVITEFLKKANSYTDISPSGEGLHVYLALSDSLKLEANRHSPFEAYTSGRFFTWSENSYHKRAKPIRTVSPAEALKLLEILGYPWKTKAEDVPVPEEGTSFFTDEDLLKRMFESKNGNDIKSLYEGDTSSYKGDTSRADAAFLNHLAFWSRKDTAQMERVWMSSPLGSREKVQKRKDYRVRSIGGAVKNTKEVFKTQEERIKDEFGIDFLYTLNSRKERIITQNTENICRILRYDSQFLGRYRYDAFTNTFEFRPDEEWRAFEDHDAISIQTSISVKYEFFQKVGKDMVFDAIMLVAKEFSYDSALDYIRSEDWDKIPRLDTWLSEVYGVEETDYHKAVGSNWMKGLVKRIAVPGCKFDYVLVLEGGQGVRKSTSLHILGQLPNGRNMHVETTMGVDSKDFFMQFSGKAIVEFSEGETLSRTEIKKMKAIITMQSDKYRPPYGRVSLDFPRRCVFAMTTNQDEYLKDETGNRRWLPVRVVNDKANIEWLEKNRLQLLAEAYYRVIALNETVHEFPEEETRAQQEARRISDPNEEKIVEWYYSLFLTESVRQDGVTPQMAFSGALSGFGAMKKHEEMAIVDVYKRVLKLKRVRRMVNNVQAWRWVEDAIPSPVNLEFEEEDLPFHEKAD